MAWLGLAGRGWAWLGLAWVVHWISDPIENVTSTVSPTGALFVCYTPVQNRTSLLLVSLSCSAGPPPPKSKVGISLDASVSRTVFLESRLRPLASTLDWGDGGVTEKSTYWGSTYKREVLFCTWVLVLVYPVSVRFAGLEGTWKELGVDTWRRLGRDLEGTWTGRGMDLKGLEGSWKFERT